MKSDRKMNIIKQFQDHLRFLVRKEGLSVDGAGVLARRSFRRTPKPLTGGNMVKTKFIVLGLVIALVVFSLVTVLHRYVNGVSAAETSLVSGDVWTHPAPLDVTVRIVEVASDVQLGIRIDGGTFLLTRANPNELQNWLTVNGFNRRSNLPDGMR